MFYSTASTDMAAQHLSEITHDGKELCNMDIEQYYTTAELEMMCENDKVRLKKIKQTYLALGYYGLSLSKPWFMQKEIGNTNTETSTLYENMQVLPSLENIKSEDLYKATDDQERVVGHDHHREHSFLHIYKDM